MDIALWIVTGILAAVYLFAGVGKLTTPREKLVANPQMAWTNDFSQPVIRSIGAVEILGVIGLVIPWLTGIAEVLTPLAAVGLVLVQIGAIAVHSRRGETKNLPFNVLLLLMAAFVAVSRFADL